MFAVRRSNYRHLLIDLAIFLSLFALPSIVHLFPFPLYLIEPMRIALFTGYLLSRNTGNAIFLALAIPMFSFFTTGHPIFFKSILISFELVLNIWLFIWLFHRFKLSPLLSMILAILTSKLAYYAMKYALLQLTLIHGSWVSTGIQSQLVVLIVLSALFGFLFQHYFKVSKDA